MIIKNKFDSVGREIPSEDVVFLKEEGWGLIPSFIYTKGKLPGEISDVQAQYGLLEQDPYGIARCRSYVKMHFNIVSGDLSKATVQSYSQSYQANSLDGGKIRYFPQTTESLLRAAVFQSLVKNNLDLILRLFEFKKKKITIGLHSVRYLARDGCASYSSPIWLHKDDEPVVVVNVINESPNLVGGDSVISFRKNEVNRIVHMKPFEGMVLTKSCFHAVTPMGVEGNRMDQVAYRDILLTTVEEDDGDVILKPQDSVVLSMK